MKVGLKLTQRTKIVKKPSTFSASSCLSKDFIGPVHPRTVLGHVLNYTSTQQHSKQIQHEPSIKLYFHPCALAFMLFLFLVSMYLLVGGVNA